MSKRLVSLLAIIGMSVGGYIPVLFGDSSFLDGWSILGGLVGGIAGIWLGVQLAKRFG